MGDVGFLYQCVGGGMLSREDHMGCRRFKTLPRLFCDVLYATDSYWHKDQTIKAPAPRKDTGVKRGKLWHSSVTRQELSSITIETYRHVDIPFTALWGILIPAFFLFII